MVSCITRLALLAGLLVGVCAREGLAQGQVPGNAPVPPCICGGQAPHYHVGPTGMHSHTGAGAPRVGQGGSNGGSGFGASSGNDPGTQGPMTGLPRGRRYYGGRFFGSFNNRYYGPQYGNF